MPAYLSIGGDIMGFNMEHQQILLTLDVAAKMVCMNKRTFTELAKKAGIIRYPKKAMPRIYFQDLDNWASNLPNKAGGEGECVSINVVKIGTLTSQTQAERELEGRLERAIKGKRRR